MQTQLKASLGDRFKRVIKSVSHLSKPHLLLHGMVKHGPLCRTGAGGQGHSVGHRQRVVTFADAERNIKTGERTSLSMGHGASVENVRTVLKRAVMGRRILPKLRSLSVWGL